MTADFQRVLLEEDQPIDQTNSSSLMTADFQRVPLEEDQLIDQTNSSSLMTADFQRVLLEEDQPIEQTNSSSPLLVLEGNCALESLATHLWPEKQKKWMLEGIQAV